MKYSRNYEIFQNIQNLKSLMFKIITFYILNPMAQFLKPENQPLSNGGASKLQNMQISLKLSRAQKHTKLTLHIQFQPRMILTLSFIGASDLPVIARTVLYQLRSEVKFLTDLRLYRVQTAHNLCGIINHELSLFRIQMKPPSP